MGSDQDRLPQQPGGALMSKLKSPNLVSVLREQRLKTEGAIFRWLWDNHAAVLTSIETGAADWQAISEIIRATGATGKFGGKASRWQVAKTWVLVCQRKEVAETRKVSEGSSGKATKRTRAPSLLSESNRPKSQTAPPFASSHVTNEAPRQSLAEVPDSALPLPKVPTCVIPPNETPEERIARNHRLLQEQFRRTDAWLGVPVTRKKP